MTMRHLTLICMAGISTSLLVNKMKRLIQNENLEIAVTAMSERAFQGYTVRQMFCCLVRSWDIGSKA